MKNVQMVFTKGSCWFLMALALLVGVSGFWLGFTESSEVSAEAVQALPQESVDTAKSEGVVTQSKSCLTNGTEVTPGVCYQKTEEDTRIIHLVRIEASALNKLKLMPVLVSETPSSKSSTTKRLLQTVGQFAEAFPEALVVINAGYFDPMNGQTTSWILKNKVVVANPTLNKHLTENPVLKPYLPTIFNRSEFRLLECNAKKGTVDSLFLIAQHNVPPPPHCQIQWALGAGPSLIPEVTHGEEAFTAMKQGKMVRDPIGVGQHNARSAIGVTAEGDVLLLMVEQSSAKRNSGASLFEVMAFLAAEGATQAMNLDGGSSSSIYIKGVGEIYGKKAYAKSNNTLPIKRPVLSVLMLSP